MDYDNVGNLILKRDQNGNYTTHQYDSLDRLVSTKYYNISAITYEDWGDMNDWTHLGGGLGVLTDIALPITGMSTLKQAEHFAPRTFTAFKTAVTNPGPVPSSAEKIMAAVVIETVFENVLLVFFEEPKEYYHPSMYNPYDPYWDPLNPNPV